MTGTYNCPVCRGEVEVEDGEYTAECVCGALLELQADADFVNGKWRDLSYLVMRDDGAEDRKWHDADRIRDDLREKAV